MVCTVFILLIYPCMLKGQNVETVHQHFDGGCPFDVECQSHIPTDALAISLIDFLVP